jgi:AraC-like DNA-binding protein
MSDGGHRAAPTFWRDEMLPFIEARALRGGQGVCYARHSHETFSIGAVMAGNSVYLNGKARQRIGAGCVVVVNPGDVHACSQASQAPWSYRMLYVDAQWLSRLQHDMGFNPNHTLRPFSMTVAPLLFDGFNELYRVLTDPQSDALRKHSAAVAFFSQAQQMLDPVPHPAADASHKLARAAEFISDNFQRPLKLDDICAAADLSASYLIRAFNKRYGMTPHAYLTNRRIQYGQAQLRLGRPIVDVALEAGFSDQAHFQRSFKTYLAATPGQYRQARHGLNGMRPEAQASIM